MTENKDKEENRFIRNMSNERVDFLLMIRKLNFMCDSSSKS